MTGPNEHALRHGRQQAGETSTSTFLSNFVLRMISTPDPLHLDALYSHPKSRSQCIGGQPFVRKTRPVKPRRCNGL